MFLYFNDLVLNFITILLVLLQVILYICQKDRDMILLITIGGTWGHAFVGIILTVCAIFKIVKENRMYSSMSHSYKEDKPKPLPTINECLKLYCGDNTELYNKRYEIINSVLEKHKDDNYLDAFVWGKNEDDDDYFIYQTLLPGTEISVRRDGTHYVNFGEHQLGWVFLDNKDGKDITLNQQCKILGAYVIIRDKYDRCELGFDDMYIRVYYSE